MGARGTIPFLKAFLRSPGQVGAIAPSSRALAEVMLTGIAPPGEGETLVEFGPGTGAITAAITEFLPEPGRYLGIERDAALVAHLRRRFPDLEFVAGSAEESRRILAERGRDRVRAVISGLPFASLPGVVRRGILEDLAAILAAGGIFRTFQYVHAYMFPKARRFRREMAERFGPALRLGPVVRNIPPAWVLSWGDPRPAGTVEHRRSKLETVR